MLMLPPPPAAIFLAFLPQDSNIIAIGMSDYTIWIYSVSSAKIFVWEVSDWKKQKSRMLQIPAGRSTASTSPSDTRVHFHQGQAHFLTVHESQLSIYDDPTLEYMKQWCPLGFAPLISDAAFSCDSKFIYARFLDATVVVFDTANLGAYVPYSMANVHVYTLAIAAHPQEPDQFAIGMSNGSVLVLEPVYSLGRWGVPLPVENKTAANGPSSSSLDAMDQTQNV